jgi:hypothetical protein
MSALHRISNLAGPASYRRPPTTRGSFKCCAMTARSMTSACSAARRSNMGGLAGTSFWVDPAEKMFALLLTQAPGQREHYKTLFRDMVYAAISD